MIIYVLQKCIKIKLTFTLYHALILYTTQGLENKSRVSFIPDKND